MPSIRRRTLLALPAALALPGLAVANDWPARRITYVVPFAPGGFSDVAARIVAERLTRQLGQSVVIDNRPGGGGALGVEAVARTAADGHTLLGATNAPFSTLPHLGQLRINPLTEIAPVGLLADVFMPIIIHPSLPARTLPELVAHARANPGKLSFGSGGVGTVGHLSGEYLKARTGIDMVHVPYRGSGPSLTALLANEVQILFGPEGTDSANEGKLRAIAIMGQARWDKLPQTPTTTESGFPDWVLRSWQCIAVAAATPLPIRQRLNALINDICAEPEVAARIAALGGKPARESLDQLAARARADYDAFGTLIRDARITAG